MRISDRSSDVCSSDLGRPTSTYPAAPARIAEDVEVGRPGVEPGADPAIASRRARQRVQPAYLGADRAGDVLDQDRKSVVSGNSVSVRVDLGGRSIIKTLTIYVDTELRPHTPTT